MFRYGPNSPPSMLLNERSRKALRRQPERLANWSVAAVGLSYHEVDVVLALGLLRKTMPNHYDHLLEQAKEGKRLPDKAVRSIRQQLSTGRFETDPYTLIH